MIIYKITNQFYGKSYIGMTQVPIAQRWRRHISDARYGSRFLFHKAIRKYGPDAFKISKIAYGSSREELARLETRYIKELNTKVPNGYNLADGGEGIGNFSDECNQRRREALIGHVMSEETRRKISESLTGRRGAYVRDAAHRLKMSAATKGKPHHRNGERLSHH
jgi:group I intron endonuclease